jgi:hypothetical protein
VRLTTVAAPRIARASAAGSPASATSIMIAGPNRDKLAKFR